MKWKRRDRKHGDSSAECATTISLDITAVDQRTVQTVKQQLEAMIDAVVATTVEINDQLVAEISEDCHRQIKSLESTGVSIAVGMQKAVPSYTQGDSDVILFHIYAS